MTAKTSPRRTAAEALEIRHRQTLRSAWGSLLHPSGNREKTIVDQPGIVDPQAHPRQIHPQGIQMVSFAHASNGIICDRTANVATSFSGN